MEQKAENVFKLYKNELIQKLGRKALSNDTIDKYGKLLFNLNTKVAMLKMKNLKKRLVSILLTLI